MPTFRGLSFCFWKPAYAQPTSTSQVHPTPTLGCPLETGRTYIGAPGAAIRPLPGCTGDDRKGQPLNSRCPPARIAATSLPRSRVYPFSSAPPELRR